MKPTLSATVLLIALLFVPSLAIFNTTTCSSTQYYDTTTMNCESCQTNASPDSTTSCKCNPGFYYSQSNLVGWRGTCTACPSSTPASSTDRKTCMACPTGSTPTTTTTTTGTSVECVCTSGIAYDVGIDGEVTTSSTSGTSVPTKVCLTCPTGTYQDPDGKGCIDCGLGMTTDSSGSCTCTTGYTAAGSSCVATSDATSSSIGTSNQVSAARTVTYTDVESTTGSVGRLTMTSGTIDYLYTESVVGCILYKDPTSCQVFANLCILLMGSVNTVICKLYQNTMSNFATVIGDDAGFIEDLPWIYYWNGPLTTIYDANIQLTVTLGKGSSTKVSLFDFFVAKYAINGTYLGTETLTNQLLACPNSVQAGDYLKTFGTPFISNCDLDLSLLETTDTIFYELFLVDTDGTNVDIPVKVYNLVTSTGATPNTGDLSSNTVFTRRFFIYDTVLGLSSSSDYLNGATPAVIRFAKNVRLVFEVQTDDKSKINRPYLEIEYASKQVVDFTTNSTSYATFKSVFQMDISSFWTTVTILFIITNILAGLVAIFRTYVWARYNPARFNPESWPVLLFFRLILNLMKAWSEAMFFFLFIITAYWFIFYKMQNTVYFIVPDEDTNPNEFVAFRVVFGLTVSFNILSLLNMIREQVQMDFFIIDWEKPRLTYKRDLNREVYLQSAWRMILVANEFNELQTSRYYPIELLYMIYGFFMIGLKWEQFSAVIPSLTTTVGDGISRDIVLKFFLAVFLMFVIGMILYGLRKAITLKVPTSIQEFTDLCSIANISIFFFDKQFHGYYLHGMAPSGQSEGSISELKRYLDLESKGTVRSRGLLANDPTHLQTYEIFFPWEARQAYNNLYKAEITKEIYARQAAQQMSNQVQLKLVNKALPNDFDFQKLEGRRLVIQEHLKLYIEGVRVESGKLIRDKTPSMRFFGIPPVDIETLQGNPLFYKDDAYGFQNTVFYGNEFSMLISDILIYTMWDIIVQNTFIALFLSYFTNKFIAFLRQFFGERNISQKALIDDAFLI